MPRQTLDSLSEIVAAVRAGRHYQQIAPDMVQAAVTAELGHGRSPREAAKAARNRLHQAAGAFLPMTPAYDRWLTELRSLDPASASWQAACRQMMHPHASTRERLPFLERFYTEVMAACGPVHSVLDLACGLNPLALPWMPLTPLVRYRAYDIFEDLAGFLRAFFALSGVEGEASACDITQLAALPPADVTLLLKIVPSLDQLDRAAAARLLQFVRSPHAVVSFPRGGLGRGPRWDSRLAEARLDELIAGGAWTVRRIEFPNELVFVLRTADYGSR